MISVFCLFFSCWTSQIFKSNCAFAGVTDKFDTPRGLGGDWCSCLQLSWFFTGKGKEILLVHNLIDLCCSKVGNTTVWIRPVIKCKMISHNIKAELHWRNFALVEATKHSFFSWGWDGICSCWNHQIIFLAEAGHLEVESEFGQGCCV